MKKVFAIIFICLIAVLGFCIFLTTKNKKKISKILRFVLIFALLPTIANFVLMIATTQVESNLAYAIFYGSVNWLLVSMVSYCTYYTGVNIKPKWFPLIFIGLNIFDSASMFLNPIFGHAYHCYAAIGKAGEVLYLTTGYLGFKIHLAYSYFLSILCFGILIYKLCTTAKIYWKKYLVVLGCIGVVLIWDACFATNSDAIDTSVIGYTIGCSLLTYFTLIYKPRPLINSLQKEIVDNSENMILFFDSDGECIFANEKAKDFFNLTTQTINDCKPQLKLYLKNDFFPTGTDFFKKVFSIKVDGENNYIRVEFKNIKRRNKLEGTFYSIENCTEEFRQKEIEQYKATHNELTGLFNKAATIENTEKLLTENPDQQYYVVATDIKNFKMINSLFGRDMGDKILLFAKEIFTDEKVPNELLGHLGADRFIQIVKAEDLETNLNLFTQTVNQTSDLLKQKNYSIIVHAGVYKIAKDDFSAAAIFDRAYMALSSIKNKHENCYAFYDDNMLKTLVWEQQVTTELDKALEERQFEVYLQPQTDRDCNIIGAEALVRWNHPGKGLLPPNQFISIFEKNGIISKLDYYMWDKACQLLAKWKRLGKKDFYISVNLSPLDFYYMDVYESFMELVSKYGISPKNLHLEVTEITMMSDAELKMATIERLNLAGFVLSLDDFGDGYSSLNILKDLPISILKLDMEFFYHAKNESKSKIIITQTIELAKKLGISVLAESVESQPQLDFLKITNCDAFQGYYFTIPIPVQDFEEKYFK